MELPIDILYLFLGLAIALPILGFFARFTIPPSLFLFVSGGLLLSLFLLVDIITIGSFENIHYTLEYPMQVTVSDASSALHSTGIHGMAERPVNTNSLLYLEPISCITADLSKTGLPVGTATIGIIGGTNVMTKTFATLDVSTLTTTQRTYTFCLPNHDYWTISLYDRIGILYNGGSSGNQVNFYYRNSEAFDSTNSVRATLSTAGTWTDSTTTDVRLILTYDKAEITNEAIPFEFTEEIKVFMMLFAVVMLLAGGVTELDARRFTK